MATQYKNDKGFLVIEMSYDEATILCNFGCQTSEDTYFVVCDTCNNRLSKDDKIYYVAVLNRALCSACCEDFIKGYDKHEEDVPYEIAHYNYYAKKLNLEEV